jgi:3-methylcrotonyl-CoA carboxylase beta subunit
MEPLDTQIRPDSPEFRENRDRMSALVAELRDRVERARQGGGERYIQRHRQQGKLPVRERLDLLRESRGATS